SQLRTFERDKLIEKAIHRDFQEMLAISEKRINKEIYARADDAREEFPSASAPKEEIEQKLDSILAKCSSFTHAFVYNGDEIVFRTQPAQMEDRYVKEEHDMAPEMYKGWFKIEGKYLLQTAQKKPQQMFFNSGTVKRSIGEVYMVTAVFPLPGANKHQV